VKNFWRRHKEPERPTFPGAAESPPSPLFSSPTLIYMTQMQGQWTRYKDNDYWVMRATGELPGTADLMTVDLAISGAALQVVASSLYETWIRWAWKERQ
jgi:hypothetical protein